MEPKDTITISSLHDLIDDSETGTYSNTVIGGGYASPSITINSPYVTTTSLNPWASITTSPKIQLDGEGADIKVNGWSLIESIRRIEERLNILTPNDKQATWNRLKAMPPPEID